MGGYIPPLVQGIQVNQARPVRGVRRQIECEAKSSKVALQMLLGRVATIQFSIGAELVLNQWLESWPDSGNDHLSGFTVQVTAESLEMGAKEHDVPAQVLVGQVRIRRGGGDGGGALEVDLVQARHPIVLPIEQGDGWHGRAPSIKGVNEPPPAPKLNRNRRETARPDKGDCDAAQFGDHLIPFSDFKLLRSRPRS
jgi:hypothetical protein